MSTFAKHLSSTLGKKYIMALTGAGLFAFVVGHLIGNLQVFGSPDLINSYAHFLKSKPAMVWGARIGLLACAGLHIATAVSLMMQNRDARPEPYAGKSAYGSTWASRYMILSGGVVLAFIVYHLAHFTVLLPGINGVGDFSKLTTTIPGHAAPVPDVYAMMVLGFQVPWVALFYVVAQVMLFLHLGHGLSAMFQSLGLRDHNWWPRMQCFAKLASIAVLVGYLLIPAAIMLRLVGHEYSKAAKIQMTAVEGKGTK